MGNWEKIKIWLHGAYMAGREFCYSVEVRILKIFPIYLIFCQKNFRPEIFGRKLFWPNLESTDFLIFFFYPQKVSLSCGSTVTFQTLQFRWSLWLLFSRFWNSMMKTSWIWVISPILGLFIGPFIGYCQG